jgi:hypothetical protein
MAATGEPYAAARRQAITGHSAASSTSPVSAEDIRAAAAAHRELGPEYGDAVVASFIENVDRAVAARVEARLADCAQSMPAKLTSRGRRLLTRRVARDVLAAGAGALVAVGAVGLHAVTSPPPVPSVIKVSEVSCASRAGNTIACFVAGHGRPRIEARVSKVVAPGPG